MIEHFAQKVLATQSLDTEGRVSCVHKTFSGDSLDKFFQIAVRGLYKYLRYMANKHTHNIMFAEPKIWNKNPEQINLKKYFYF